MASSAARCPGPSRAKSPAFLSSGARVCCTVRKGACIPIRGPLTSTPPWRDSQRRPCHPFHSVASTCPSPSPFLQATVPFFLRNALLVESGLWRTREFCRNFTAVAIWRRYKRKVNVNSLNFKTKNATGLSQVRRNQHTSAVTFITSYFSHLKST